MKNVRDLIALILLFSVAPCWAQLCNIYIHGYTSKDGEYFGNLPRQVEWDSSLEITKAAPLVADGLINELKTCPTEFPVILRPHSYGASIVFYILAQGRRFQTLFPHHPFVKIYKRTSMVISYTGAYHGTPIMDLVCNSNATEKIAGWADKTCVPSLLTSPQLDVSSYVTSPGVPTFLVYSTNHSGFLGVPGLIIGKHGATFSEAFDKNYFNQNDNTLPTSASMACGNITPIFNPEEKCKKLDGNYFIDIFHETRYSHLGFIKNEGYMTRNPSDFINDEQ